MPLVTSALLGSRGAGIPALARRAGAGAGALPRGVPSDLATTAPRARPAGRAGARSRAWPGTARARLPRAGGHDHRAWPPGTERVDRHRGAVRPPGESGRSRAGIHAHVAAAGPRGAFIRSELPVARLRRALIAGSAALGPWIVAAVPARSRRIRPSAPSFTLRFVTFNLLHGGIFSELSGDDEGLEERLRITVEGLRALRADVVGLQEASTGRRRGDVAARWPPRWDTTTFRRRRRIVRSGASTCAAGCGRSSASPKGPRS